MGELPFSKTQIENLLRARRIRKENKDFLSEQEKPLKKNPGKGMRTDL